ncbi:MAG: VOC family protein [Candidatus Nitrosopolaris sp.]|jgi:catechol 2,3-dioxygenase-like lactoylglutathione lyase family enzyme
MIKEANVTVIVSDLNRAIKFYTETLGLKLVNQIQTQWAEIQGPGLTIGLHPAGTHGPKPGNSESLAIGFTVDNLDNDIITFTNKGIVFSANITEDGPVRLAFFTDPDKNPLYLCEVRQNSE